MLSGRDGTGGALGRAGGADRAALTKGGRRAQAVSTGNHAAHSPVAELVFAERPGDGGGAVRDHADAPVRAPDLERADPRRHHAHEVPAPAGEAPTGGWDSTGHQWLPAGQGPNDGQGTIVDATIIHAPSSTKHKDGKRDPEMHQTKKGNQYFFGMKAHIGAEVESGLVHHVHGTAANVANVTQVAELLHGEENAVYADVGYTGGEKREEHAGRAVIWQIAARHSTYSTFAQTQPDLQGQATDRTRQSADPGEGRTPISGHQAPVRLRANAARGLVKNTAQLTILFALSNLWMARKHVMGRGELRV